MKEWLRPDWFGVLYIFLTLVLFPFVGLAVDCGVSIYSLNVPILMWGLIGLFVLLRIFIEDNRSSASLKTEGKP